MIRELGSSFFYYDRKALNQKIMELRKASNESSAQCWDFLCIFLFKFLNMKLIGNFSKKDFSIFFMYLKFR